MNKPIIHYEIIATNDLLDLTMEVNRLIDLGWQPLGSFKHIDSEYYQTVVKYQGHGIPVTTSGSIPRPNPNPTPTIGGRR